MKKILPLLIASLLLISCASANQNENDDSMSVVTTSYVTYELTKAIAVDENITLLVKPGQSGHNFEPTAQDMVTVENSDLLIYTNDGMEPWVNELLNTNINKLDASMNVEFLESDHDHSGHGHADLHTWTSMNNAVKMVETIRDALVELSPENEGDYINHAKTLIDELNDLDSQYATVFQEANIDTLVFLGHFGLNYLMHDYDFEYIALFESMSHETEPTISQMSLIIDTINEHALEYVFVEELSQLKLINTIEEETGVKTLILHSSHNVSQQEFDDGLSFIQIQKQNIENLKIGLNNE